MYRCSFNTYSSRIQKYHRTKTPKLVTGLYFCTLTAPRSGRCLRCILLFLKYLVRNTIVTIIVIRNCISRVFRMEEPQEKDAQTGLRSGLYGWRKRCLYTILFVLLLVVTVNVTLVIWIIRVLQINHVSKLTVLIINNIPRSESITKEIEYSVFLKD